MEFPAIVELADEYSLTTSELRHLTLIAARRIHYAFAFATLARFCRDALHRFPDDELLTVLRCAADVLQHASSWEELEAKVAGHPAEGISRHVLLTSVYLSEDAPRDVLERALELAGRLVDEGDLIALYRKTSILRRLGRYEESLEAGMQVNEELVGGKHAPSLCDHLSERVLVERHITVELMGLRGRDGGAERAALLWNMGL